MTTITVRKTHLDHTATAHGITVFFVASMHLADENASKTCFKVDVLSKGEDQ